MPPGSRFSIRVQSAMIATATTRTWVARTRPRSSSAAKASAIRWSAGSIAASVAFRRRADNRRRAGLPKLRVWPGRARRWRGSPIEPGAHGKSESIADRGDRLWAEAVGTDACDAAVLLLEPEDDLERLAAPPGRELEEDRLA